MTSTLVNLDNAAAVLRSAGPRFPCSIAHNAWGVYCVPAASSHRPAPETVLGGRVWEMDTIAWISQKAGRGDIVHAGAFFGDFLPALSATRIRGEMIWAFEPNEENFLCAAATILLNSLQQVTLLHAALSDQPGTLPIRVHDGDGRALGGASHLLRTGVTGEESGCPMTRTVAVDEVLGSTAAVRMIHLDVEGSEPYALAGAWDTILRCRPALIVESLPPGWMMGELADIGYQITARIEGNTMLECRDKEVATGL